MTLKVITVQLDSGFINLAMTESKLEEISNVSNQLLLFLKIKIRILSNVIKHCFISFETLSTHVFTLSDR